MYPFNSDLIENFPRMIHLMLLELLALSFKYYMTYNMNSINILSENEVA